MGWTKSDQNHIGLVSNIKINIQLDLDMIQIQRGKNVKCKEDIASRFFLIWISRH